MRIALFSDTLWPQVNGVSLTLRRLVDFLEARDCRTLVVGPRAGDGGGASLAPRSAQVIRIAGLPLPRYPELKIAAPWSRRALDAAREFEPEVVHVLTEFTIGWLGLRTARRLGAPVVSSFHTDFPRYIGYYGLGAFSGVLWRYLRWFHERTKVTYCPSAVTREQLRRRGFGDVRIWGRGVDLRRFAPDRRDPALRSRQGPPSALHLLYVGRLAPEKDLDLLFDAVRRLPATDFHLIVTGDGPHAARARARAPANATFTGYLTGSELSATFASADLFVFPSRTETYGNAVLEALASGLPVVAFAEGGVLENVRDGVNGSLCPPGDVDAFVAAILRLAREPGLRARQARAARAWAERRTWDRAFDGLLAGYREAAGRRAERPQREPVAV
jgi:glycosyltransferase involved in cell wall biosynthesis